MTIKRQKLIADFTSILSLKLGIYMEQGLFVNYPENFNNFIPKLAEELLDEASRLLLKQNRKGK